MRLLFPEQRQRDMASYSSAFGRLRDTFVLLMQAAAMYLCSPDDIGGMHASKGVLTSRGGMTSHAAVVARGWGKVCELFRKTCAFFFLPLKWDQQGHGCSACFCTETVVTHKDMGLWVF